MSYQAQVYQYVHGPWLDIAEQHSPNDPHYETVSESLLVAYGDDDLFLSDTAVGETMISQYYVKSYHPTRP